MPDHPGRILIRGELVAQTAISVGSGDRSATSDSPVIRDFYDDPYIPGTSLAGVLRAALDTDGAEALFGRTSEGGNDRGEASRVFVSSAWLIGDEEAPSWRNRMTGGVDKTADKLKPRFLRDHVRIGHESGSAEAGGKFDEEIVPRGTRFGFELEWRALAGDTDQDVQLRALTTLLAVLRDGNLRVGGSTTRGLGRIKAVQLDAREVIDWKGLAALKLDHRFPGNCRLPAWRYGEEVRAPAPEYEIAAKMEIVGPLLVGGGEPTREADLTCYMEPVWNGTHLENRFVIPGSAFKGVLRHRARHIAQAVFGPGRATDLIAVLFGPEAGNGELWRGALAVDDVLLDAAAGDTRVVPHVAIDRFTGGTVDGALFQEQPIWTDKPQSFELHISLNPPAEKKLADSHHFILAQTLIDLAFGEIRIGHGTRRGNGIIRLQGGREGVAKPTIGSNVRIRHKGRVVDFDTLRAHVDIWDKAAAKEVTA